MKLGHAAALALVGWYLMMPPWAGDDKRLPYDPLSNWILLDTFDSQFACQQMRKELIKRMNSSAMETSRCVQSSDPDLPRELQEPLAFERISDH